MSKIKNLSKIFIFIFMIGLVSANGLTIINENIDISKTYEVDKIINLTIKNEESFDFFDMEIEESDIAEVEKFNLTSGENKTILVTIKANDEFSGELTFRGQYETTIGHSNKTEIVKIDYNTGFDQCYLELVVGDKISWENEVLDNIKLVNSNTGADFADINEGGNYIKDFNDPMEFDYYATRIGLKFTETCRINVQNDEGLVHSNQYDAKITTNIAINYDLTTIEAQFLDDKYTINYNSEKEDVFKIENIGDNEGKNIKITGDWITFSKTNFDLDIDDSTNIAYVIKPEIFETNETNKTHIKTIIITGNFGTIEKEISIFIPYKKITSIFDGGSYDIDLMENFIIFFCKENPDSYVCPDFSINSSCTGTSTVVEFSAETVRDLIERQANKEDEQETYNKNQTELGIRTAGILENLTDEIFGLKESQDENNEKTGEVSSTNLFIIILVFSLLLILLMGYAYKNGFFTRAMTKAKYGYHKKEKLG